MSYWVLGKFGQYNLMTVPTLHAADCTLTSAGGTVVSSRAYPPALWYLHTISMDSRTAQLQTQIRLRFGVGVRDTWVQQCVAHVTSHIPTFPSLSQQQQEQYMLDQLLNVDLSTIAEGGCMPSIMVGLACCLLLSS